MKSKFTEHPTWFFAWTTGKPYITAVCGWTRKQVIQEVTCCGKAPWKKFYREGGRVIRCKVMPLNKSR